MGGARLEQGRLGGRKKGVDGGGKQGRERGWARGGAGWPKWGLSDERNVGSHCWGLVLIMGPHMPCSVLGGTSHGDALDL